MGSLQFMPLKDLSQFDEDKEELEISNLNERQFLNYLLTNNCSTELIERRFQILHNNNETKHTIEMSIFERALSRIPAIMITIFLELLVGLEISYFHPLLEKNILMTSFLPILSSISGNIGLQTSTSTIRALSAGFVVLEYSSLKSLFKKELGSASVIGICAALAMFILSIMWSKNIAFAASTCLRFSILTSVILSCAIAGIVGASGPVLFYFFNQDPAAMAGPFETALQDLIGTFLYLFITSILLR